MLFGQSPYLSVHTGHWWSILRWKVLLRSQRIPASIPIGNGVLRDNEGKQRFLSTLPSFKSQINICTVPVIAIFTKFDDLVNQIYDMDLDDDANRKVAEEEVEKKFRKPLSGYAYPPRADVCFEGEYWLIFPQSVDRRCSTPLQPCILRIQVNIKTRLKHSLRRRHPPWMIPLWRCCLFQCSKIILSPACKIR